MSRFKAYDLGGWRYRIVKTTGFLWWKRRFQRFAFLPENKRPGEWFSIKDVLSWHYVVWEDDPKTEVYHSIVEAGKALRKIMPIFNPTKSPPDPWKELLPENRGSKREFPTARLLKEK